MWLYEAYTAYKGGHDVFGIENGKTLRSEGKRRRERVGTVSLGLSQKRFPCDLMDLKTIISTYITSDMPINIIKQK